jgi:hypothetical protein
MERRDQFLCRAREGWGAASMIVALTGPSAVGKTTWRRANAPGGFVEQAPENMDAPDLFDDPEEVARFWVEFNSRQWREALRIESEKGIAVCDGDPFTLYFSWSAWKAGAMDGALFAIDTRLYRSAFEEGRVGFADLVLSMDAPIEELRRRKQGDSTRRRRRHELYLSMIPFMKSWFASRERVLPGTVWSWSAGLGLRDLPAPFQSPRRYDLAAFDGMIEGLGSP